MAKGQHKGAKEFLLGAFIGGVVGITAVSLSRSKGKKTPLIKSIAKIASTQADGDLADFIDWTAHGIQLWNKLKKGK
jgi:gas vesicle protein